MEKVQYLTAKDAAEIATKIQEDNAFKREIKQVFNLIVEQASLGKTSMVITPPLMKNNWELLDQLGYVVERMLWDNNVTMKNSDITISWKEVKEIKQMDGAEYLTAQGARDICSKSEAKINQSIGKILLLVEEQAKLGKKELVLNYFIDAVVVNKLHDLGYSIRMDSKKSIGWGNQIWHTKVQISW
jgi:hypothetical protein